MNGADETAWRALGDPVRRSILDGLRAGPQTTGAIAGRFRQTRFGVMKHLAVLERAGLIIVERRGRERWNHLNAIALREALDRWLTPFHQVWTDQLSALAAYLDKDRETMAMAGELDLDIRLEIGFEAPATRVFRALTAEIDAWWRAPYRQTGENSRLTLLPAIGEPLLETGGDGHSVIWGRVEEIHAPRRLYLSGTFAVAGAVAGRVRFDLEETGGRTRLRVAHLAVGAIDDEARARFGAGWRDLIDVRLRNHLEGGKHG